MFTEYHINKIDQDREESGKAYFEFHRIPAMSVGLYVLPAGGTDGQTPHNEDEIYYVLDGRAKFRAGDTVTDAVPGALLYVAPGVDHRFFDIEEELRVLVFFAPAET